MVHEADYWQCVWDDRSPPCHLEQRAVPPVRRVGPESLCHCPWAKSALPATLLRAGVGLAAIPAAPDSWFTGFHERTKGKDADAKAALLEGEESLSAAHTAVRTPQLAGLWPLDPFGDDSRHSNHIRTPAQVANEGQSEVPASNTDVNLHFICFVCVDGERKAHTCPPCSESSKISAVAPQHNSRACVGLLAIAQGRCTSSTEGSSARSRTGRPRLRRSWRTPGKWSWRALACLLLSRRAACPRAVHSGPHAR